MTSSTSIGSGQPTVTATTVLDGLGRAVLASGITYSSTTDPNNSGGLRYGGVVYNNLGQVLYSYNPYFASTDQTSGYTTYQYDALGRKTNVETPSSNNIGFTYTNRAVEETDFAGFQNYQTITQFDGLGRMIDVCQLISGTQANGANPGPCSDPALGNLDISGTGFDTSYSYDALGRMTTATFWSQTRSFAYDGVGRMTSETTPEAGTKTYVYDHSPQIGDLYTRTAPLENHTSGTVVTTYAFDLLHRLTQVSYNDSLTPTISYAYDQTAGFGVNLTNYKGRLTWSGTSAAGINGANGWDAVFGYDAMGRVAEYSQCTLAGCSQGITFAQAFSYDYAGDLLTGMSTIAGGGTMNPTYNSIGQLTQLSTNCIALSGSSCVAGNVVSNIKYDALGQPVSDTLGTSSGLNEVWSYNKNGENTGYAAGATYNYALTYGQPTVITSSTDAVNGNWNYTYDSYNRLICAWKGSACNSSATLALNWTYDQFGNLWTQGLLAGTGFTKSFSYTQPAGGSINQITTAGYAYDAAGNMTNDTFHTYKYDADGRVLTVDGGTGNGGWTYNYNSRGLRNNVYFNNGGGPNEWLYNFDGTPETAVVLGTNTQGWSEFYVGRRHLATWQVAGGSYGTVFQLTDWLGTSRYMLNYSGTPFLECASLPFGEQTSSGNCESNDGWQGISGLWFDEETDSVHTKARQLSLHQGRWLTPDPAGPSATDVTNPQTWNRYAYVTNNPVSFSDPTGLCSPSRPCPHNYRNPFGQAFGGSLIQVPSTTGTLRTNLICWSCPSSRN